MGYLVDLYLKSSKNRCNFSDLRVARPPLIVCRIQRTKANISIFLQIVPLFSIIWLIWSNDSFINFFSIILLQNWRKKNFDPKRLYFKNIAIIIFISYIFYQKALTSGFRMIPYFNSCDIYKYVKYLFISARFFEPKNWPIQRHRSLRNPMLRVKGVTILMKLIQKPFYEHVLLISFPSLFDGI